LRFVDDNSLQGASRRAKEYQMFQLCFCSLFGHGRAFSFPCDSRGAVDMDTLTEKMRLNYLFARAMVGRELAAPAVVALA
jgi:hypothetical protein